MADEQEAAVPAEDGTETVDRDDELHYPPVENGLDYMASVVEHLRGDNVSRRDLKYAVVHLQAAVECLLKYRLELEHWTLVFANPGNAKRGQLDDGSLNSCTTTEAIARLTNIAGVVISKNEIKALDQVANLRNALQHYGRPHDPSPENKVNRYKIQANTAEVLEFLMHFLEKELLPRLPGSELQAAAKDMESIRDGLSEIYDYGKARMNRIRARLADVADRAIGCPICTYWAVAVKDGTASCLFCLSSWTAEAGAAAYVAEVLRRGWGRTRHDDHVGHCEPVERCPSCEAHALVRRAGAADELDRYIDLCFSCGETDVHPEFCEQCRALYLPVDGEMACDGCLRAEVKVGS